MASTEPYLEFGTIGSEEITIEISGFYLPEKDFQTPHTFPRHNENSWIDIQNATKKTHQLSISTTG